MIRFNLELLVRLDHPEIAMSASRVEIPLAHHRCGGSRDVQDHWGPVLTVLVQTLMSPTVFVFGIMEPADEMGVVVQLIGSSLSFVVILAVVTRSRLFLGSLPNDTELLVGVLNNLLQSLLKVHCSNPGVLGSDRIRVRHVRHQRVRGDRTESTGLEVL